MASGKKGAAERQRQASAKATSELLLEGDLGTALNTLLNLVTNVPKHELQDTAEHLFKCCQDMYARCLIVPQPSDTDLVKALQILETAEYTCQSWGRTRLCQVTVWAAEVNGLIPPFVKRKTPAHKRLRNSSDVERSSPPASTAKKKRPKRATDKTAAEKLQEEAAQKKQEQQDMQVEERKALQDLESRAEEESRRERLRKHGMALALARERQTQQQLGRISGRRALPSDLTHVKFSPRCKFQENEIVLVPRSRGGFTYATVSKRVRKRVCHLDNFTAHAEGRYRVIYDGSYKDCSAEFLGKLNSNAPLVEPPSSDTGRVLGQPVSGRDLDLATFAVHNTLRPDEVVIVPRSQGGFTYGRIMQSIEVTCQAKGASHPAPGWRVQVSSDSDASRVWKDLSLISIGKLLDASSALPIPAITVTAPTSSRTLGISQDNMGRSNEIPARQLTKSPTPKAADKQVIIEAWLRGVDPDDDDDIASTSSSLEEDIQWCGEDALSITSSESSSSSSTRGIPVDLEKSDPVSSEETTVNQHPLPTFSPGDSPPGLIRLNNIVVARLRQSAPSRPNNRHVVVIDGPNVGMRHSNHSVWSMRGVHICYKYYKLLGLEVVIFLPEHYAKKADTNCRDSGGESDSALLNRLVDSHEAILTPAQDYDDSYAIAYAKSKNGCIVTNDRYWDHIDKFTGRDKSDVKQWIRLHSISYTFVGDEFLPNPDFKWPR